MNASEVCHDSEEVQKLLKTYEKEALQMLFEKIFEGHGSVEENAERMANHLHQIAVKLVSAIPPEEVFSMQPGVDVYSANLAPHMVSTVPLFAKCLSENSEQ